MKFEYVIKDSLGIHARPAGLLVAEAKKYKSSVTIEARGKKADAKRIFAVMSLGVKCGDVITVLCEGEDAEMAIAGMKAVVEANL